MKTGIVRQNEQLHFLRRWILLLYCSVLFIFHYLPCSISLFKNFSDGELLKIANVLQEVGGVAQLNVPFPFLTILCYDPFAFNRSSTNLESTLSDKGLAVTPSISSMKERYRQKFKMLLPNLWSGKPNIHRLRWHTRRQLRMLRSRFRSCLKEDFLERRHF